uniref:NADH-ubiquinone oxidoreductase chain 2 n=1 Tax=Ricania marginalis TaxID=1082597 RepID=K7NC19_9HEMI|nr:NADH dehydrogenase subunit 2 [Ricania marginalis]
MKMNLTKMLMMMTMIMSATSALSSSSMLMTWMMMEINLMAFLPIMTKSKIMKDQPMKYLIIQSLASSTMLMSILLNSMNESPLSISLMLMGSMLMKMGLMPFHMWVPMIMNSMSWQNCFIMITWQKIIPTIIISQMLKMSLMMLPMCLTLVLSPVIAMNQTSMKKIMSYSSMSNSPWMITSMMNSKSQFMTFFLIYTTINLMIMKKMKEMNLIFINQMKMEKPMKKLSMIVNMLSMSGMPPMMGFFPKWMILQSTIKFSLTLSVSMILSSMISTFIYVKMISPMILSMNSNKKINKKEETKKDNDINMNIMGTLILMMTKS